MAKPSKKIQEILRTHRRVAVTGGPDTGKSIVTDYVTDRPVYHSDAFTDDDWHTKPDALIREAYQNDSPQGYVVAGITADRAVRKGLQVDAIIHCETPRKALNTRGRKTLKTQIDKRVRTLEENGIPVYYLDD